MSAVEFADGGFFSGSLGAPRALLVDGMLGPAIGDGSVTGTLNHPVSLPPVDLIPTTATIPAFRGAAGDSARNDAVTAEGGAVDRPVAAGEAEVERRCGAVGRSPAVGGRGGAVDGDLAVTGAPIVVGDTIATVGLVSDGAGGNLVGNSVGGGAGNVAEIDGLGGAGSSSLADDREGSGVVPACDVGPRPVEDNVVAAAGSYGAGGGHSSRGARDDTADDAGGEAGSDTGDGVGGGDGSCEGGGATDGAGDATDGESIDKAIDGVGGEAVEEADSRHREDEDASGGVNADKENSSGDADIRDGIQFFRDLGMGDAKKVAFFAGLLRDFRKSDARLDSHLVGYKCSVHAAVSRLLSPSNPQASPEHVWIRVHDRLGFFIDNDGHAHRIINVGLAFAYRHLEMDAIAVSNAKMLQDMKCNAEVGIRPGVAGATGGAVTGGAAMAGGATSDLQPLLDGIRAGGAVTNLGLATPAAVPAGSTATA